MRKETDASIRLLVFLGSAVPSDGRDADGPADEQTQRQRRERESLAEMITLFGQVDIGRHDGLRTPVNDDREIGFRIVARADRRGSLFHRDDRSSQLGGTGSSVAMDRSANAGDLGTAGGELHVAVQIDDFKSEHMTYLLRPNEESHALRGRWLPIGYILDIRDIFCHVFRPTLCGRGRIPIEQIVNGRFENLSDADGKEEHNQADEGGSLKSWQSQRIGHRYLGQPT